MVSALRFTVDNLLIRENRSKRRAPVHHRVRVVREAVLSLVRLHRDLPLLRDIRWDQKLLYRPSLLSFLIEV